MARRTRPSKLIPLTVMISQAQADQLTRHARENMISVSQVVRGIITRSLADAPAKPAVRLEKGLVT